MNEYESNMLKAGVLAKQVRAFGKSLIVVGASYNSIILQIKSKILELGAVAAFPPQIAINDVAAHYLPAPNQDVIFDETMVVSLDIGVCVDGAIGDCAVSVDLTADNKYKTLIEASQKALEAAQSILKVGLPIGEIGRVIEETIQSYGFEPVRNLSGHGVGKYEIHTKPGIPNYDTGSKKTLEPGMTFAIEPFATSGSGMIHEVGEAHIFSFSTKRAVRSPTAKILLKKIATFQNLPFDTHDLVDAKTPYAKVKFGLRELIQSGIIAAHPPLVEVDNGIVTQAENTVMIDSDGIVHITTQ